MLHRSTFLLISAMTLVVGLAAPAIAAEPVVVSLASGRTVQGTVDPRSTDDELWLRRGDAEASITRKIDWQRITHAERAGEELSLDQLKALAKDVATDPDHVALPLPRWHGVFATPVEPAPLVAAPLPPIRTLAIDAFHANWDNDVESDGLVIIVMPLDAHGQVVAVTGSLEVELIAPEVRRFHDAPHGRGLTLERIGRWNAAISSDNFAPSGARVELPFQAIHPEFDTKILPQGLVHARLVVPGQGTFDTTADYIRIRPWSPLRDKYWRDTGRRFFPAEQTGRSKRID